MNIKLSTGTVNQFKALVQAGKVLYGKYNDGQLMEDMLAAFKKERPEQAAAAEKYLEAMADQPDEPLSFENVAQCSTKTKGVNTRD